MNAFQKQLMLKDGKNMAELSIPSRDGIGQPLPPVKASVEDFERERRTEQQRAKKDLLHG